MLENGETLSVGLACTTDMEMGEFKELTHSLAMIGGLERYKLVGCNTGRRRNPAPSSVPIEPDSEALLDADRAMEELLETVAVEKVSSAKSSEKKREKKKQLSLKKQEKQKGLHTEEVCSNSPSAVNETPIEVAHVNATPESNASKSSQKHASQEKLNEAKEISQEAPSLIGEASLEVPSIHPSPMDVDAIIPERKREKKKKKEKAKNPVSDSSGAQAVLGEVVSSNIHSLAEEMPLKGLRNGVRLESASTVCSDSCMCNYTPTRELFTSEEDFIDAEFLDGWSVVRGRTPGAKTSQRKITSDTDVADESWLPAHDTATVNSGMNFLAESYTEQQAGHATADQKATEETTVVEAGQTTEDQKATKEIAVVEAGQATAEQKAPKEIAVVDVQEVFASVEKNEVETTLPSSQAASKFLERIFPARRSVVSGDQKTQTVMVDQQTQTEPAIGGVDSDGLRAARIGDYKVDESTPALMPMVIVPISPRPSPVLGRAYEPAKINIPGLQLMYTSCSIFYGAYPGQLDAYPEHLEGYPEQLEGYPEQLCAYPEQFDAFPEKHDAYPEKPAHVDSDGVSESSTMCCWGEQCLKDAWENNCACCA
jgi:hypothetical protein